MRQRREAGLQETDSVGELLGATTMRNLLSQEGSRVGDHPRRQTQPKAEEQFGATGITSRCASGSTPPESSKSLDDRGSRERESYLTEAEATKNPKCGR